MSLGDHSHKIRIVVISSVRPEPTSAGQLILHRHLADQPEWEVEVYGAEPERGSIASVIRRFLGRLLRNMRWKETVWTVLAGRWIDHQLPRKVERASPTVVMTVAHGDGYLAAMRFARKHCLPLATIFHDWWPSLANGGGEGGGIIERRFRELYRRADLVFCVSDGMKQALGPHPGAEVLYPIPGRVPQQAVASTSRAAKPPFKLVFFGNLGVYGDMVRDALETFENESLVHFEARGSGFGWPEEFTNRMREAGGLLPFLDSDSEFREWLESADAFLIPVSFDPQRRKEMETNFPSKLVEAAQYGKPLIVWAPPWSSAAKWAASSKMAFLLDDPQSKSLPKAVESALELWRDGGDAAPDSPAFVAEEFDPEALQQQFLGAIRRLCPATDGAGMSGNGWSRDVRQRINQGMTIHMTDSGKIRHELSLLAEVDLEKHFAPGSISRHPLTYDSVRGVYVAPKAGKTLASLFGSWDAFRNWHGLKYGLSKTARYGISAASRIFRPRTELYAVPGDAVIFSRSNGAVLVVASNRHGKVVKFERHVHAERWTRTALGAWNAFKKAGMGEMMAEVYRIGSLPCGEELWYSEQQLVRNTPKFFTTLHGSRWPETLKESVLPVLEQFHRRNGVELVTGPIWAGQLTEKLGKRLLRESMIPAWRSCLEHLSRHPGELMPVCMISGDLQPQNVHFHQGAIKIIDWSNLKPAALIIDIFCDVFYRAMLSPDASEAAAFWQFLTRRIPLSLTSERFQRMATVWTGWMKGWFGMEVDEPVLRLQLQGMCWDWLVTMEHPWLQDGTLWRKISFPELFLADHGVEHGKGR